MLQFLEEWDSHFYNLSLYLILLHLLEVLEGPIVYFQVTQLMNLGNEDRFLESLSACEPDILVLRSDASWE